MKLLSAVLGFLLWAATLALGAYAAWVSFTGRVPWDVLDYLLAERALGMAAGVFLVGVAILWPLSLLCPAGRERYLAFENPGGEVRISLDAIKDFLGRLGSEFPSVVSLRAAVQARNGALVIHMDCRVRAGAQIPAFSQALQERVKQAIQSSLGLSEVEVVRVTVREIVGAAGPAEPTVRAPRPGEDHGTFDADEDAPRS